MTKNAGGTVGTKIIDWLLRAIILLWLPVVFWLKWTSGPASSLYDGSINAEITSFIILWAAWALLFIRLVLTKKVFVFNPLQAAIIILIALYFFWSLASVNWSVSAPTSFNHASLWLHYLLFALFFVSATQFYSLSFFVKAFSFWSLTLSLPVIYLYYRNGFYVPYLGMTYNRSIVGEALCSLVPVLLAISWIHHLKRPRVNLCAICAILGYIAVLIMGQRAPIYALWLALTGLGIAGFFFTMISKRTDKQTMLLRLGGTYAVLGIFSLLYLIPSPLTGNLQSWDSTRRIYNVSQAADVGQFRVLGLAMGWLQLKEHPLTGSGAGTFPLMNFATREKLMENPRWHYLGGTGSDSIFNRAHCEPAQVAGELGFPGLLLWSGLFVFLPIFILLKIFPLPLKKKILLLALVASTGAVAASSLASSFGPRTVLCMLPWLAVMSSISLPSRESTFVLPKPALLLGLILLFLINIASTLHKIDDLKSCYYADLAEVRLTFQPTPTFQEIYTLYEKSIAAAPHLPSAYSSTALLLARHGKLPETIDYLKTAHDLGFQSQFNLILQTWALGLGDRTDEAIASARRLEQIAPGEQTLFLQREIFEEKSASATSGQKKSYDNNHPILPTLMRSTLNKEIRIYPTSDLLSAGQFAFWVSYYIQPTINDLAVTEKQALYLRQFYKPSHEN